MIRSPLVRKPQPGRASAPVLRRNCARCGTPETPGCRCSGCERKLALQRRLAVGASNDPAEREADRAAEQALLGGGGAESVAQPPALHRRASAGEGGGEAPASVHQVLAQPGRPLEATVRRDMEGRFGQDFSKVRVHDGAEAGQSARDVDASAYTVGSSIAFAPGRYAPGSGEGRKLLAHELGHVVQQGAAGSGPARLQRQNEPAAGAKAGADKAPQGQGDAEVEDFYQALGRFLGVVGANAGEPLSWLEKLKIEEILAQNKVQAGSPLVAAAAARFVLHDTSAATSAAHIKENEANFRGPRGGGTAAYVPASGDATLTRPDFFDPRRPTATEWEKNVEAFREAGDEKLKGDIVEIWKARRDAKFRAVWNATEPLKQEAAFERAMAGLKISDVEKQEEKTGNKLKGEMFTPGVKPSLAPGSKTKTSTSASWTVEAICAEVQQKGAAGIARKGQEPLLTSHCLELAPYFAERNLRVGSTVNVEIVEPGTKDPDDKSPGAQNTCNPNNPNNLPLPSPVYSDSQYKNVALLYLRTAYVAGTFPEITTHFAIDRSVGGHCDPRCFNLAHLYGVIAAYLGHGAGSTYGISPVYGLPKDKSANVWWHDKTCHGKHP